MLSHRESDEIRVTVIYSSAILVAVKSEYCVKWLSVLSERFRTVAVTSECSANRVFCKTWTKNSAYTDLTLQNAASDQDLHFT